MPLSEVRLENIDSVAHILTALSVAYHSIPESDKAAREEAYQNYFRQKKKLDFLRDVAIDIASLNALIKEYNSADDSSKLIKLQDIYQFQKKMDCNYSPNSKSYTPSYLAAIYVTLFKELKTEFASLGITSLYEDPVTSAPKPIDEKAERTISFPEILANMAPEKTSKMLLILSSGATYNKSDFAKLYEGEDSDEAKIFRSFFPAHSIEFLGGINSQNFKIVPGEPVIVLKVDNRLNQPKGAMVHLKQHSLHDALTLVHAEREACYIDPKTDLTCTRTVLTTEFCPGGNLEVHAVTRADNTERIKFALDIFKQMGAILSGIQSDGCAFTDMKNTNWLVDSHGVLRIADTKSFVFADKDSMLNFQKNPLNKGYVRLKSAAINPPEYDRISISDVLGKLEQIKRSAEEAAASAHVDDFKTKLAQVAKATEPKPSSMTERKP